MSDNHTVNLGGGDAADIARAHHLIALFIRAELGDDAALTAAADVIMRCSDPRGLAWSMGCAIADLIPDQPDPGQTPKRITHTSERQT